MWMWYDTKKLHTRMLLMLVGHNYFLTQRQTEIGRKQKIIQIVSVFDKKNSNKTLLNEINK